MAPAPLSAGFQSLCPLPMSKVGLSSADSRVGGLVHALGRCGSLQQPLLRGWEFLPLPPPPPWVFSLRGLRLYFPALEPWVAWSFCSLAAPPGLSMCECGAVGSASCCTACPALPQSTSHCIAASPLPHSYRSG